MSKIKLGLIGAGLAWEKLHRPAIERLRDKFEISAVCDKDISKAKTVAKDFNIGDEYVYEDYSEMLKNDNIEAVDLMLPITENFEAAEAAINSGKHIIAEKPFASSVKSAEKLIKLAEKSKSKILVAENYRYSEENILIKNLIEEKKIGTVAYFIDNNITEFQKDMLGSSFASTEWRQHPEFRGGIFLDSAIHHIARHRFLFGNVVNISAHGRSSSVDFSPYSCITALLTFEDTAGLYAFHTIGKETQAPFVGLRIFGTKGEIFLENKECGFVNVSYKDGGSEAIPYKPEEGYYCELNNFYNSIRNGDEIISTPQKELGDIQTIFDILDSIEKESTVKAKNNF